MVVAYRGGNWNNGANAGVFNLNGNNARSNSNTNIGFRSALSLQSEARRFEGAGTEHRNKGTYLPAPA